MYVIVSRLRRRVSVSSPARGVVAWTAGPTVPWAARSAGWPFPGGFTDFIDHWRCRFVMREMGTTMKDRDLQVIMERIAGKHTWMHIEKLQVMEDVVGFSKAQGEE